MFGSGNFLGVQVNTSKYNRTLSLTTTDPYFTPDGISRTFSVLPHHDAPVLRPRRRRLQAGERGRLPSRFGVPFSEVDTVFFGIGLERYAFDPSSSTAFSGLHAASLTAPISSATRTPRGTCWVVNCDQKSVWGVPLTHRLGPRQIATAR